MKVNPWCVNACYHSYCHNGLFSMLHQLVYVWHACTLLHFIVSSSMTSFNQSCSINAIINLMCKRHYSKTVILKYKTDVRVNNQLLNYSYIQWQKYTCRWCIQNCMYTDFLYLLHCMWFSSSLISLQCFMYNYIFRALLKCYSILYVYMYLQ